MAGTHEDAVLLVELAKLAAMNKLTDSIGTILGDDFDPNAAEFSDPDVRAVLNFHETVGALVANGLLNRELVLDWLWAPGTWARVQPAVAKLREAKGAQHLYEHYEALAQPA